MKFVKIKGKREPLTIAEWEDIEPIVKRHLKKYRKFYEELAEL